MTNITLTENQMYRKLGKLIKCHQRRHTHSSIHIYERGQILRSYGVIACVYFYGGAQANYYFTRWSEYSRTTQKHVKEFCGWNKADREKAMESDKAGIIVDA